MTILYLVRHGVTAHTGTHLTGRAPGAGLTDEGRAQAAAAARFLMPSCIKALFTSPLERTAQTADVIGDHLGLEAEEVAALNEVDYGSWTGRRFTSLTRTKLWDRVQRWPSAARFPGGETLAEVQARSVAVLDELCARHPKAALCCVTHAEVIRLVAAYYLGVHIDLFQRIVIAPASVSVFSVDASGPRVLALNTVPHRVEAAAGSPS